MFTLVFCMKRERTRSCGAGSGILSAQLELSGHTLLFLPKEIWIPDLGILPIHPGAVVNQGLPEIENDR